MSLSQFLSDRVCVWSTVGAMTLLSACASPTPVLDSHFGEAVRAARTAQTLYPQASANRDPVKGLDGQAGAAAMERYQQSFKSPPSTFEIQGIGDSR